MVHAQLLPIQKNLFLYVSCEASNAVSVIDTLQQKEVKQIPVGDTTRTKNR